MQGYVYSVDPALARVLRGPFAKELCRSIERYLEDRDMSASRFGREAMNDPGFVSRRLGNGTRVRLHSADRARSFMGEQAFGPVLVCETRTFLEWAGLKAWSAGYYAVRQRAFVKRVLAGGSPLLKTIDRFRRWMHRQMQPAEREAVWMAVAGAMGHALPDWDAPEPGTGCGRRSEWKTAGGC